MKHYSYIKEGIKLTCKKLPNMIYMIIADTKLNVQTKTKNSYQETRDGNVTT